MPAQRGQVWVEIGLGLDEPGHALDIALEVRFQDPVERPDIGEEVVQRAERQRLHGAALRLAFEGFAGVLVDHAVANAGGGRAPTHSGTMRMQLNFQ